MTTSLLSVRSFWPICIDFIFGGGGAKIKTARIKVRPALLVGDQSLVEQMPYSPRHPISHN